MFDSGSRDSDEKYIKWAKEVKVRDNYTCQICGKRGSGLHSHHINGWDKFPELRYEISAGTTLCIECHDDFHQKYGFGGNTEMQYVEYKLIYETLKKIAKDKIDAKKNDK